MTTEHLIQTVRLGTFEESTKCIIDVLNGHAWLYERRDVRYDIQPYAQVSDALRNESEFNSNRISQICVRLLQLVCNGDTVLSQEGKVNLLIVLRDCSADVVSDIVRLVDHSMFQNDPDQHARLLQVLVAQKKRQDVRFWVLQNELLGPEYAAVTFSGILLHGLIVARVLFSKFFTNELSMRHFTPLAAWLLDNHGQADVASFFRSVLPDCGPAVQQVLTEVMDLFEIQNESPHGSRYFATVPDVVARPAEVIMKLEPPNCVREADPPTRGDATDYWCYSDPKPPEFGLAS